MIKTIFVLRDRNFCLHGRKDNLIKDVRMVRQTKDTIIYVADSVDGKYQRDRKNSYIRPSAVFAYLRYLFFDFIN